MLLYCKPKTKAIEVYWDSIMVADQIMKSNLQCTD